MKTSLNKTVYMFRWCEGVKEETDLEQSLSVVQESSIEIYTKVLFEGTHQENMNLRARVLSSIVPTSNL